MVEHRGFDPLIPPYEGSVIASSLVLQSDKVSKRERSIAPCDTAALPSAHHLRKDELGIEPNRRFWKKELLSSPRFETLSLITYIIFFE